MPLSDNDREWMIVTLRDGLDSMVTRFMTVCTSLQARVEGLEHRVLKLEELVRGWEKKTDA